MLIKVENNYLLSGIQDQMLPLAKERQNANSFSEVVISFLLIDTFSEGQNLYCIVNNCSGSHKIYNLCVCFQESMRLTAIDLSLAGESGVRDL